MQHLLLQILNRSLISSKVSIVVKRRIFIFLGGLLIVLLLSVGLRRILPPTTAQSPTLLIAAAASLQNALEEIDPLYERSNGITVNYNFAASGSLQQQIEQGAPVDVFISAATRQMDALQSQNLILADTRRNLLANTLVLIAPRNALSEFSSFQQLTRSSVSRISMGEPRSVPAGQYAQELLMNLGVLEQVRSKFVYGNSVRNVLAAVESGNADAGVVYATDAKISARVRQVAIAPSNLHAPIVYPIAVIRSSRNPQSARAYAQFLGSSEAQTIFRKYGFSIP